MYRIEIENNKHTENLHDPGIDTERRAVSCQFTESVNEIPHATITIFPQNPAYQNLQEMTTLVRIINTKTGETEFEGRVLNLEERKMSEDGVVTLRIECEGLLAYLCDSIQMYKNYENVRSQDFLSDVIANHNAVVSEEKQIIYSGVFDVPQNTNSKTTAYRSTLDEIKENLISRIGGELRLRRLDGKLYLDYMSADTNGKKSSTTVALARNMQSMQCGMDASNIITRIIPLGSKINDETAERITLKGVFSSEPERFWVDDENALSRYGGKIICGTVIFDDITTPVLLVQRARDYLENNNRLKKAYKATVLDLSTIGEDADSFRAGNTYRFKNELLGLDEDLRIIKRTVDIFAPYKPSIEIGDKTEKITDIAARTARLIEYEMPQQKIDILKSAKQTATNLLTSATPGYVVFDKERGEILIMDTPSIITARKVWRWNSSGLGYSSTGYTGEYGLAMTIDGAIVADYITAGTLTGIEINNGNKTFHVDRNGNVDAASINITGGSIHIETNSGNYDVIELSYDGMKHQVSPLQWVLEHPAINAKILCQAGGLFFYTGSTVMANFGANGNLTTKGTIHTDDNITADGTITGDIYFKQDNGANYSLKDVINGIYQRLDALES